MCNNKHCFNQLELYTKPAKVCVGDGTQTQVLGIGNVSIISTVSGKTVKGELTKVLYVPELATNLFSIGASSELGFTAVFNKNQCSISRGKVTYLTGVRDNLNDLYTLSLETVNKPINALITKRRVTKDELHELLGHPGEGRLDTLLKNCQTIELAAEPSNNCAQCTSAKGTLSSHPSREGPKATEVGDLVHLDLVHAENKNELNCYFLLSKDEFSEFCFVHHLNNKSDVHWILAQFLIDFEFLSGKRVKATQSDNGSEFLNRNVKLLLLKENIKHLTSSPYTPQQNGVAERAVRTINTMARALLAGSNLPIQAHRYAVETACYLNNRLPTKRDPITPFQRLTNREPDYSHLIKFGTEAHAIINYRRLDRYEPRTQEGFIVGYTQRRNTYKILLKPDNNIIETSDFIISPHIRRPTNDTNTKLNPNHPIDQQSQTLQLSLTKPESPRENLDVYPRTSSPNNQTQRLITSDELDSFFENINSLQLDDQQTDKNQHNTAPIEQPKTNKLGQILITGERLMQFFRQYLLNDSPARNNHDTYNKSRPHVDNTNPIPDFTQPLLISSDELINTRYHPSTTQTTQSVSQDIVNPESRSLPQEENTEEQFSDYLPSEAPSTLDETQNRSGGNLVANHVDSPNNSHHAMFTTVNNIAPNSYSEAISGPHARYWSKAIDEELEALTSNNTWQEVDRPGNRNTLSTKWVFTTKPDLDGHICRFKARLVAKGFQQRPGIDFHQTYSPVCKFDSIRVLLAIAAAKRLAISQFDVTTAFLYGNIDEEIYIEAPEGISIRDNRVLKLKKALYGLKQAPKLWYDTFSLALKHLNFVPTKKDACVFTNQKQGAYLILYVDDGLVFSHQESINKTILQELNNKFKIKTVLSNQFLGMELQINEDMIRMNQKRFIKDILERFHMEDSNPVSNPMLSISSLANDTSSPTKAPYREATGALQYLAQGSRPDILFAVNNLSKYNDQPTEGRWSALKRVFKYIKATSSYELQFKPSTLKIEAYSDANWATDTTNRRSTSGVIILLGGAPVAYASRQQQ